MTEAAIRRPLWWGVLLTVAGWAVLGVPMLCALLLASAGFSGCFISCSEPDPAVGIFGAAALVIMIAAPVLAAVALVRRSRPWWIATGCLAGTILVPLAFAWIIGAA